MFTFEFNKDFFANIPISKEGRSVLRLDSGAKSAPAKGQTTPTAVVQIEPVPAEPEIKPSRPYHPELGEQDLREDIKASLFASREETGDVPHDRSGLVSHGPLAEKLTWHGIDQLFKRNDPRVADSECKSLFLYCVSLGLSQLEPDPKPRTYNYELAKAAADYKKTHGHLPAQGHDFLPAGYVGWGVEIQRITKENMTLGKLVAFYEGYDDPKTGPPPGKMATRKQIVKAAIKYRKETGRMPHTGRKYLPADCVGWVQTCKNLRREKTTLERLVAAHEKVPVRHGGGLDRRALPADDEIARAAISFRSTHRILPKIGKDFLPEESPGWGVLKERLKERGVTLGQIVEAFEKAAASSPTEHKVRECMEPQIVAPYNIVNIRVSFDLANDNAHNPYSLQRKPRSRAHHPKGAKSVSASFVDSFYHYYIA